MKETTYKVIQIENDNEIGIGEIWLQDNEFFKAELFIPTFGCLSDIEEVRKFLDIVEEKMKIYVKE